MTGGFGGTFGSIFGTTTTTGGGTGGVDAVRAKFGSCNARSDWNQAAVDHWNSFPGGPLNAGFNYNTTVETDISVATDPTFGFMFPGASVVVKRLSGDLNSFVPNGSGVSSQDSAMTFDAQQLQRITVAQGNVPQILRCFYEWDGTWMLWAAGSGHSDYTGGAIEPPSKLVAAMRQIETVYHRWCPTLELDLCGDLGCGNGFNSAYGPSWVGGHALWDQVYGVLGGTLHGGIIDYLDVDVYSNGGTMPPAPKLQQELDFLAGYAKSLGMRIAHGEWGIGNQSGINGGGGATVSGDPHYYDAVVWTNTFCNWWASLPASGAGSLGHIELFDQPGPTGPSDLRLLDGRSVSYCRGQVSGQSEDDGHRVVERFKVFFNTVTVPINVTGTGRLDGGGTLAATGHQNIILLADHPEVVPGTDCSDTIQAIINAAPNGTIIRAEPVTYLLNESSLNDSGATLVFDTTRNFIQFDGNGCTFQQTVTAPYTTTKTDSGSIQHVKNQNLHRAFFSFLGADHCKVYNATFIGVNPNPGTVYDSRYESQHIFNLEGVDDFEAYDFTAHHNWGDMCALQPNTGTGVSCSNVHFHDYTYHDNGRQHMTVNGVTDMLVENGNAFNIRRAHIDLEPNFTSKALKPQIKRVTFRGCTFGFMQLNLFSAGNTEAGDVDTITFDTCTFFQWKMPDVEGPWTGTRRKNLTIINCTTTNPFGGPQVTGTKIDPTTISPSNPTGRGVQSQHGVGLGVQQWDGVHIEGNTISLQNRSPTMVAVWCLDCTGINVKNNTLTGSLFPLEIDVTPGAGTVGTGLLAGGGTLKATGFPTQLATSAVLIGGGSLVASGTVGVVGTGALDGGGSLAATGVTFDIVDVSGVGLLDGGGSLSASGIVLELGAGLLDGGGSLVASGDVGAVDATGLLDGGGDLSASASVGDVGVTGTGRLDGGGVLTARGRTRRRHGWHIGPIRLRPPGYGRGPYGRGPYGGLN